MNTIIRILGLFSLLVSAAIGGGHEYHYDGLHDVNSSEKNNPIFNGDFERILRYKLLQFTSVTSTELNDESKYNLNKIFESVEPYVSANANYKIVIIGHTRLDKEKEYELAQKSTLLGSWQNSIMESVSNDKENSEVCVKSVEKIKQEFIDHNVSGDKILTECRNGTDPLYLENDGDARVKNHRVNVVLYQSKNK
ncbi:MAG: hypothetical protein PHU41_02470 [Sulfuricurvum sp.]|nr:hypothetical protein [Sulfuricurvum sp.]